MPIPADGQVLSPDVLNTHTAWVKVSKEIVGLMLMTMDLDIQKNLEHLGAYDMLKELKTLCAQQADQELLQTSYIDNLECLGHAMTQNLSVSLILVSLRKEYDGFVQNYNMHSMGKTVTELHAMLKLHEQTLPPREAAHALYMGYAPVPAPPFAPKPKNPPTPKKDNPAKDAICHQCGEVVSSLFDDGFVNRFDGNVLSVSKNNLVYFSVIPKDGIYEIDLSSSNTNDSFMYAISNKRAKPNLDSTLLWHCRLGHISKKRIEKLQHDGLLNSTDIKSFE
ncbi:zinc finger, CCHC-type containing protein, partial [Tanacetum coccineum]